MHAFRAAVEARDFDALPALFAADVVFRSPIAHKPYRGRDTVAIILRAAAELAVSVSMMRVTSTSP